MITSVFNDEGAPIEVGRGTGDLRRGSVPFSVDLARSVWLVERHVSFSRLFASQPLLAGPVNWLLRQAKRVPLYAYRRVEGDSVMRLEPKDHPLAAALVRPWGIASQQQLVSALLGSYLIHGNSVAPIDSGARNAIRLEPVDWRYTIPIMPWRGAIEGWEVNTDSPHEKRTLTTENVMHVAEWSPLGPFGLSPLQQLGVTIAIEDAAQRHQRAELANGVRSPVAVKTTDDRFFGLDPAERKQLMDQFRGDISEIMAGPENAGRPWLLPPGLDVTPVGQTAVEAQLIEQRAINRTESMALYGVTPATQGVIERSAELPEQRQMSVQEGLAPALIQIEACMTSQVCWGVLKEPDVYVAFDFSQILRGNFLAEIEALSKAVGSALYTPNEGREQLGKPRSNDPAMDKHYLPRNNLIPTDVPYKAKGEGETGAGEESHATAASEGD